MGLLSAICTLAGTSLASVVVGIGVSEFSASAPSWARRIIHRAACALPEVERLESEAEWLAHLEDIAGNVSKLFHACGLLRTAVVARASLERPSLKRPAFALIRLEKPPMPIRPQHRWLYPIDWRELSASIRIRRTSDRCEGCGRPHGRVVLHLGDGRWWDEDGKLWRDGRGRRLRPQPPDSIIDRTRGTRVVLATCRRDHDPHNDMAANLAAFCQRCHILHDKAERRRLTYLARRAIGNLFTGPYE